MSDEAIRVEGLRFAYTGGDVLHGLSFTVRRGEVTGLIGPNGAGKSTTLKILTGLLEPREGRVEVEGLVLPRQAFELKQRLGYVPENAELYESLTAQEFLELCGRLHGLEERLLQARIDLLLDVLGLSEEREGALGSYSKGMRQKILEPLGGLDADAAVLVKTLLSALAARGRTILYSSHVLDVVERVCARVLILDRGRVIADGSPDELKTASAGRTLEAMFREVTREEGVEPRVNRILEGLRP